MVTVKKRFVRSLPSFRVTLLVLIAGSKGRRTENPSPLFVYRLEKIRKGGGPIPASNSWHIAPLTGTTEHNSNKRIRFVATLQLIHSRVLGCACLGEYRTTKCYHSFSSAVFIPISRPQEELRVCE